MVKRLTLSQFLLSNVQTSEKIKTKNTTPQYKYTYHTYSKDELVGEILSQMTNPKPFNTYSQDGLVGEIHSLMTNTKPFES